MKVLVTGSSGLIGSALCERLNKDGHTVLRAVRVATTRANTVLWNPIAGTIDAAALQGVNAVVHLAGAGIGDKRWTDEYKKEILQSRTLGTSLLARTLSAMDTPPSVFLSSSAIGIYGPRNDEELTETSATARGFLADVCTAWEESTAPAVQAKIRTVLLRTGIVLSPNGGALKKQLPLFKLGLGGKFGNGRQWQSWISITDEVGAIIHLMNSSISGPVNLTAPEPVTNSAFTSVLGSVLGRPAVLPIPTFGPKLLLGTELANALLFTGQRVLPQVLQADGYKFEHPTLEVALRALLNK